MKMTVVHGRNRYVLCGGETCFSKSSSKPPEGSAFYKHIFLFLLILPLLAIFFIFIYFLKSIFFIKIKKRVDNMPILFDRVSDFKGALSFEALKNKRVSNVLGIPRSFMH